jgi:hypothetical protein
MSGVMQPVRHHDQPAKARAVHQPPETWYTKLARRFAVVDRAPPGVVGERTAARQAGPVLWGWRHPRDRAPLTLNAHGRPEAQAAFVKK